MKRDRRAQLKERTRRFAAAVVWSMEATASGHFDDLDLSHEEQCFIEDEMQAISRRILASASATGTNSPQD